MNDIRESLRMRFPRRAYGTLRFEGVHLSSWDVRCQGSDVTHIQVWVSSTIFLSLTAESPPAVIINTRALSYNTRKEGCSSAAYEERSTRSRRAASLSFFVVARDPFDPESIPTRRK